MTILLRNLINRYRILWEFLFLGVPAIVVGKMAGFGLSVFRIYENSWLFIQALSQMLSLWERNFEKVNAAHIL